VWSLGKETACLVEELLALGEQEEHGAAAEELDPRAGDARAGTRMSPSRPVAS
jgi:hypothetical protein